MARGLAPECLLRIGFPDCSYHDRCATTLPAGSGGAAAHYASVTSITPCGHKRPITRWPPSCSAVSSGVVPEAGVSPSPAGPALKGGRGASHSQPLRTDTVGSAVDTVVSGTVRPWTPAPLRRDTGRRASLGVLDPLRARPCPCPSAGCRTARPEVSTASAAGSWVSGRAVHRPAVASALLSGTVRSIRPG